MRSFHALFTIFGKIFATVVTQGIYGDGTYIGTNQTTLNDRVIKVQSLQVDTISVATLTSKGYLKAVKNALEQARK